MEIENALQSSRFIGLVMSPQAFSSEWVAMERSTAMTLDPSAKNRTIMPILRKPCEIPYTLKRLKYLDFSDDAKYEQTLDLLLGVLRDIPSKRGYDKSIDTVNMQEDQRQFEELLHAFERPAFRISCIYELFLDELTEAVDDTQAALNTGKLYSRNHNLLHEVTAVSDFRTVIFRNALSQVLLMLSELKNKIVGFSNFYKSTYPDFSGPNNFMEMYHYLSRHSKEARACLLGRMDEIDMQRNKIIDCLNSVNNNQLRELPLIKISSSIIPSYWD